MSRRDPPARGLTIWAFKVQRRRAKQREIAFRLTYQEWFDWWTAELAKIGNGAARGRGSGRLVMCRYGDAGAYELGNIFAATQNDNVRDGHRNNGGAAIAALKAYAAEHGYWIVGRTGAEHPQSKSVLGFPSITAAAEHYGVSRTEIRRRIASGRLTSKTVTVENID